MNVDLNIQKIEIGVLLLARRHQNINRALYLFQRRYIIISTVLWLFKSFGGGRTWENHLSSTSETSEEKISKHHRNVININQSHNVNLDTSAFASAIQTLIVEIWSHFTMLQIWRRSVAWVWRSYLRLWRFWNSLRCNTDTRYIFWESAFWLPVLR